MFFRLVELACAGGLAFSLGAFAAPFTPRTDDQILETLPTKASDPLARELRTLRSQLKSRPSDPELAEKLARRYFDLAMAEGDPRYIGYAEATLKPWSADALPANLLLIRALLRQYKHDFTGALDDLGRGLAFEPTNVELHSWRAAIFMVQARYDQARAECVALAPRASDLFSTGCVAYVDATTGKTRAAYDRLANALARHADASSETKVWNLTRLADMARRLGDPKAAEKHFRQALASGITDNFLLAAFADFLLDEKRPAEVAVLLKEWARSDTLLLRLAYAETALGLPTAALRIKALEDRFSEASLRGEQLHLQEEARFRLHLKSDARAAMRLAAENWKTQREPRDAAILLEAALASGDKTVARPALDWLAASGYEDRNLQRIAEALKALPG